VDEVLGVMVFRRCFPMAETMEMLFQDFPIAKFLGYSSPLHKEAAAHIIGVHKYVILASFCLVWSITFLNR
jgi:hypothetical protein